MLPFTSIGTLQCCAPLFLLVLHRLGGAVAFLPWAMPSLFALARHKAWVFSVAGALILADFSDDYGSARPLIALGQACAIEEGSSCAGANP